MRFGHYHDDDNDTICSCPNGPQTPIMELIMQSAPKFDKPLGEDDCKCGTVIDHLAEPGDLHCQRCGAELSVEDGARINEKYWESDLLPEDEHFGTVTREEAAHLLHVSPANRERVEEYARKMREGDWDGDGTLTIPAHMIPLSGDDPEPATYKIVQLAGGWWALRCIPTETDVVKAHGPGAYDEILQRWSAKTLLWMAWQERQRG